jgi:uncharacterized OB-fold protein
VTSTEEGLSSPGVTAGVGVRARPVPAQHDQPFWDGLRQHRMVLPYCGDCAAFWYPPAPRCPRCLSASVSWRECAGSGTLWSWATVRRPFAPGLGVPYTVVQVELDVQPGLIVDSTLADAELTDAGGTPLCLGLPVTAVYLDDPRGFTVHAFQPAADEEYIEDHAIRLVK